MKTDVNKLAEHFARTSIQLESMCRFVRKPGQSHTGGVTQPFCGFIFPMRGKAEFSFNGTPYILSKGKVIHGGVQMELDRRVIGRSQWDYILILYSVNGSEPEDFSLSSAHFELETGESPRLEELLKQIQHISRLPGGIYEFRREMLFRCILDEMFTSIQNKVNKNSGTHKLFEQITDYIHGHYMNTLTVSSLAKQYNVNENRISYVFKKCSGMGPGDYLIIYRLNRAKELILSMDSPIHEVAKSVGYPDPYHFSRIFKKQFGLSPNDYRKKFKNNASGIHNCSI